MFRIFCPHELITNNAKSLHNGGYLLGTRTEDTISITHFISSESEVNKLYSLLIKRNPNEKQQYPSIVGSLIISDIDPPSGEVIFKPPYLPSEPSDNSVVIVISRQSRILSTALYNGKEKSNGDHVLFLYNPREFDSFVLEMGGNDNTLISEIYQSMAALETDFESSTNTSTSSPPKHCSSKLKKYSELDFVDEMVLVVFTFFINMFRKLTKFTKTPNLPRFTFMEPIACMPSAYIQQLRRWRILDHHVNTIIRNPSKRNQHLYKSFLWMMTFDIGIGIISMATLHHFDASQRLGGFLVSSAEWIGVELEMLLSWLVGAPVGLKLNKPFAKFLSNFFLHHVTLWRAYINLLQPLWGTILHLCAMSGIFGFSFQMSIMRDVISTMTIHVYCFYVYAARLYNLQLASLASLWRLFRGKKWNELRNRVDTTYFDIDSMFLGTLCFTIIFFLLPTTLIFYAVFAGLRLAVLGIQGSLGLMIKMVERLPLYWVFLRFFRKGKVSGHLSLTVANASDPFCLQVKLNPSLLKDLMSMDNFPLMSSLSSSSTSSSSSSTSSSLLSSSASSSSTSVIFIKFMKKLLIGELICPWIEK